ncbi:MAG TPA: substrate-binding domain-containing protein, partial [Rariglobus sp.]
MKKTTRLLRSAGLAAIALLALGACSKKTEPAVAASAPEARTILIGFLGKSQTNDVFQAAHAGARDAAAELGAKYGVKVEIDIRTPNDEDATQQAEAVEDLTRHAADGIAISCSEAGTVTPSIDKAASNGIPVICFDSDAPDSKRFAYYGTDDVSCGARIAIELARVMGGKGTVALLAGNQTAPN